MAGGTKTTKDFDANERAIIRDRARFQSHTELAAVFGTTRRVITHIVKYA